MERRRLLGVLAGAGLPMVAGCSSQQTTSDDDPDDEPDDDRTDESDGETPGSAESRSLGEFRDWLFYPERLESDPGKTAEISLSNYPALTQAASENPFARTSVQSASDDRVPKRLGLDTSELVSLDYVIHATDYRFTTGLYTGVDTAAAKATLEGENADTVARTEEYEGYTCYEWEDGDESSIAIGDGTVLIGSFGYYRDDFEFLRAFVDAKQGSRTRYGEAETVVGSAFERVPAAMDQYARVYNPRPPDGDDRLVMFDNQIVEVSATDYRAGAVDRTTVYGYADDPSTRLSEATVRDRHEYDNDRKTATVSNISFEGENLIVVEQRIESEIYEPQ